MTIPAVNRSRAIGVALAVAALAFSDSPASSQEIRGTMVDARTNAGLDQARVLLQAQDGAAIDSTYTDSMGAFSFRLTRAGRYMLSASRPGYVKSRSEIVQVSTSEVLTLTFKLDTAIALDAIAVVARGRQPVNFQEWLGPFNDRRRLFQHLGGKFFVRDDFEWMAAGTVSEALVSLVPAMRIKSTRHGPLLVLERFGRECEPSFFRNGVNVRKLPGEPIEDYLSLREVIAVEAYLGTTIPGEFSASCGAIVLWTRAGTRR